MLHIWMIALFAAVVLHDAVAGGGDAYPAWAVLAGSLGPMALIVLIVQIVMVAAGKELDARGSWRSVALAERTLAASRLLCVLWHGVSVLMIGQLDLVRDTTGDLIVIDELLVLLPPVAVFIAGWWSFYPIERRLRDATLVRTLDSGRPLYPTPTRKQWVVSNVRHQVLLTLVPLTMIAAWTESLNWLVSRAYVSRGGTGVFGALGRWYDSNPQGAGLVVNALQLLGAATIFAVSPLVLRLVWDTVRLGDGPLRERLMAMCRERGVRVRELLVWRTHGAMVNGAVMGFLGPARYILLTDALLDHLPGRQVEAVMAHEIGHARLSHVPWLAGTMIAAIGGMSAGLTGVAYLLESSVFAGVTTTTVNIVRGSLGLAFPILALTGAFVALGFVSRRFEWQADAFAAKQLSRLPPLATETPVDAPISGVVSTSATEAVTNEAAASMAGALESVARLNHIPRFQKSFRHGSIALRQARLQSLVGTPLAGAPIDRTAAAIKIAVASGLALVIGMVVWEVAGGRPTEAARQVERGKEVDGDGSAP